MTIAIPHWEPPWPANGPASFARVSSAHVKDPSRTCPELVAKKARPEVWPAARGEYMPKPPATFALGLVRDAALALLQDPTASSIDAAEVIDHAVARIVDRSPEPWATECVVLARHGVAGYLKVLGRLRSAQVLPPGFAVADLVACDGDDDGDPVEWVTWAIHHVSADGALRETHLLRMNSASEVHLSAAEVAVAGRVAAEGFRAVPKAPNAWGSRYSPAAVQPPPPLSVRVRVVGVLDGSDALVFDGTPEDAAIRFAGEVPRAVQTLGGGRFHPGSRCGTCPVRQHCRGLTRAPGLLGVAGYSPTTRTLSPSDLTKHALCPRQLHLTRDLGMPGQWNPASGPLLRGIQVHAWLAAAHDRGVACRVDDLPAPSQEMVGGAVVRGAGIATDLGWDYETYVTNRHFLVGHLTTCPWRREGVVGLAHEVPVTIWDTDANVIMSARTDLAYVTGAGEFVLRETKTLNPRYLPEGADDLLAQFPQLALAVCLLADGRSPFPAAESTGLLVELEILAATESRVVTFDATDPVTVLTARTALSDRVDQWMYDTSHPVGANPPCHNCPVTRFCPDYQPQRAASITADLMLGLAAPTAQEPPPLGRTLGDEIASSVDLDSRGDADDIPF